MDFLFFHDGLHLSTVVWWSQFLRCFTVIFLKLSLLLPILLQFKHYVSACERGYAYELLFHWSMGMSVSGCVFVRSYPSGNSLILKYWNLWLVKIFLLRLFKCVSGISSFSKYYVLLYIMLFLSQRVTCHFINCFSLLSLCVSFPLSVYMYVYVLDVCIFVYVYLLTYLSILLYISISLSIFPISLSKKLPIHTIF